MVRSVLVDRRTESEHSESPRGNSPSPRPLDGSSTGLARTGGGGRAGCGGGAVESAGECCGTIRGGPCRVLTVSHGRQGRAVEQLVCPAPAWAGVVEVATWCIPVAPPVPSMCPLAWRYTWVYRGGTRGSRPGPPLVARWKGFDPPSSSFNEDWPEDDLGTVATNASGLGPRSREHEVARQFAGYVREWVGQAGLCMLPARRLRP